MSKEEKMNIAKGIEAGRLLELYDNYTRDFNPIDYDKCETYNVIRDEILRRMKEATT